MNDWPHAPIHRLNSDGTYFITAGTHLKQHFARSPKHLDAIQEILFDEAQKHECWLQSWCLLSNHYHLVAQCDEGERLRLMLSRFHSRSGAEVNRLDGVNARRVW